MSGRCRWSRSPSRWPTRSAPGRVLRSDCVGPSADEAVAKMKNGDVLLLENTRFHAGEEKNDPPSPRRWPSSATSMSTTPSPPPIAPTPRPRRWRICCRPPRAGRCRPSSRLWRRPGQSRAAGDGDRRRRQGLDQDRAAGESGEAASTRWSSAAPWPTRSSSPKASTSASRSTNRTWSTLRAAIMAAAESGTAAAAADRCGGRQGIQGRRRTRTIPVDAVAADEMILDVGPATVAECRGACDSTRTAGLERPARRFRDAAVRRAAPSPARKLAAALHQGAAS